MKTNKFYFSINISFKQEYDLNKIEELIDLKAYKKINYQDSKGPVPSSKIIFKTDEIENIYTDSVFEEFVLQFGDKFKELRNILEQNNGSCWFSIVFTNLNEKPCLSMSNKVLTILSNLGASYDVDFI